MSFLALKVIAILAMPIMVLYVGSKIMSKIANRKYVVDLLDHEAEVDDRYPLNLRFGYDRGAVNRHWGVLDDIGKGIEQHFLKLDLIFPIIYGSILFYSLYVAWSWAGMPFRVVWLVMPVILAAAADWTENLVQIQQLDCYVKRDENSLNARWITLASAATRLKLFSLGVATLILMWLLTSIVIQGF